MIESVMIYEIKSASRANADKLLSPDRRFFYWNDSKFKQLKQDDYVIVVNKLSSWVLFCRFDRNDIEITSSETHYEFEDFGERYVLENNGKQYDKFIRLRVEEFINAPENWKWKSFGMPENIHLNGKGVNPGTAKNRLYDIDRLLELSDNGELNRILEFCKSNFPDPNATLTVRARPTQVTRPSFKNLSFDDKLRSVILAAKTKPFVLLAGLSGTGKSRLVRTLAFKTCWHPELRSEPGRPGNFELIAVRPNWHDSTELIGYVSRIGSETYVVTSFLKFVAKAHRHPDVPFFLCLDEMNLAPVEHYFAEYLSVIETRQTVDSTITTDFILSRDSFSNSALYDQVLRELGLTDFPCVANGIGLPANLVVCGTVNMDETTHSFSRKVLDRAMTIEMNEVDLRNGLSGNSDWAYPAEFLDRDLFESDRKSISEIAGEFAETERVLDYLERVNRYLDGTPFRIAYRVRDEILTYCYECSKLDGKTDNWFETALDEMTMMKILTRIEGDAEKVEKALNNLAQLPEIFGGLSARKIAEMKGRLDMGYTSFWT